MNKVVEVEINESRESARDFLLSSRFRDTFSFEIIAALISHLCKNC